MRTRDREAKVMHGGGGVGGNDEKEKHARCRLGIDERAHSLAVDCDISSKENVVVVVVSFTSVEIEAAG